MSDTGALQADEPLSQIKMLKSEAHQTLSDVARAMTETGALLQNANTKRKWWQTFVVLATSISTGFAGYTAQQGIPIEWRFGLAILVALSGAIAAVRDAWQVNETVDDVRQRYLSLRIAYGELEKAIYDTAGFTRENDQHARLAPAVTQAKAAKQMASDRLVKLPNK